MSRPQPPPPKRRKADPEEDEENEEEQQRGGDDDDDGEGKDEEDGAKDGEEGEGEDGEGAEDEGEEGGASPAALNAALRIPCQVQAATAAGTLSEKGCYRYAFIPRHKPTEGEPAPPTASKFGGIPYLLPSDVAGGGRAGAPCPCGGHTAFSFQLRADDLPEQLGNVLVPERLRGPGKTPMFQMWNCEGEEHAAWAAGDMAAMLITGARWIDASGPSAVPNKNEADEAAAKYANNGLNYGPEEILLGWEEPRVDHPNSEEQEEVWQLEEPNEDADTIMGPKLSGFPGWVQNVAYGECPECKSRMELFFEMVDDIFSTYIFVCPTHREVFATEAQCG